MTAPREIKIYCIKVTADKNIQEMYHKMMKDFYDKLNKDRELKTEIEFYTKSFIEENKFVIIGKQDKINTWVEQKRKGNEFG